MNDHSARLAKLFTVWLLLCSTVASAQNLLSSEPTGTSYPAREYYLGLDAFRSGNLEAAGELFDAALRAARIDGQGRWIDSIPSLAMLAEVHWQLGNLPVARENSDRVTQIAIRSRGWLQRVDWPGLLNPGVVGTPQDLWPAAQAVSLLPIKGRVMYQAGDPLTEARLAQGGIIEEPSLRSIDVAEVLRGLALAGYRRRIMLGPLANEDPLASALLEATKYPPGLDGTIARSLIGCVRAGGYFGSGDDERAIENAANSAAFNNRFHPLSAVTLLTRASALAGSDKTSEAVADLITTVHVAGALQQPELAGEALQLAAGYVTPPQAAMVANVAGGVAAALQSRRARLAALHCWVAGADAAVTAGDLETAGELLAAAQGVTSRREIISPRLDAYAAYVAARMLAAGGSSWGAATKTDLDLALDRIAGFTVNHRFGNKPSVSMPRIYQLNLVRQAIGSQVGNQTGDQLLVSYSRDSPLELWQRDPLDALSAVLVDRSVLHDLRVNMAASQGSGEAFLLAADAALANRFEHRLELGGRLAQIRALARAGQDALPLAIQGADAAGPRMQQLAAAAAPGQPLDDQQIAAAESLVMSIALDRNVLPEFVPPRLNDKLPVAALPPRTGLLTFIAVGNKVYGAFAVGGKVNVWEIDGSGRLAADVGRVLRAMGVGKTRGSRFSESAGLRAAAMTLRKRLIPSDQTLITDELEHLIIVPAGPLWYVPFELLPASEDDGSPAIGDRVTVRYAATPGFALRRATSANSSRAVGVAVGPLFAPQDAEQNAALAQSVLTALAEPVSITADDSLPSGRLGASIGHLLVAAPRIADLKNPFALSVSPHDRDSPFGTLGGWMRFPMQVPRTVALVGFRTPVDGGKMGSGDELFVTISALQTAGVENVLLSRWAVGGESTALLMRELMQELPLVGINDAWERAKSLLRRVELDPLGEPLLTQADRQQEGLSGDQPLFWSGYLVSALPPVPAVDESVPRGPAAAPNGGPVK
jgi:hypothetical protein